MVTKLIEFSRTNEPWFLGKFSIFLSGEADAEEKSSEEEGESNGYSIWSRAAKKKEQWLLYMIWLPWNHYRKVKERLIIIRFPLFGTADHYPFIGNGQYNPFF